MTMFCVNQVAIKIVNNPMFHECILHTEVDCHVVPEVMMNGKIHIPFA